MIAQNISSFLKAVLAVVAIACATTVAAFAINSAFAHEPDYGSVLRGQDIAQDKCMRCHEIGREGQSPHLEALPFHDISKYYPVENLAEAFAEGIYVGHPDMPAFELSVGQLTDLLSYIKAVQPE